MIPEKKYTGNRTMEKWDMANTIAEKTTASPAPWDSYSHGAAEQEFFRDSGQDCKCRHQIHTVKNPFVHGESRIFRYGRRFKRIRKNRVHDHADQKYTGDHEHCRMKQIQET